MHPAKQYIEDVLSGKQVVGKYVRLAVERHVHDIEHGAERGLHFDEDAGQRPIDFCRFIRHSTGEWTGQVFKPEPWQQFVLWNLFGWMREDGTRRYRESLTEIARKNGKSFLAAVVGLYMLVADGEGRPEIYTCATKRDQARLVHAEAIRMRDASPDLRKLIKKFRDNLSIEATYGKFEPLGADQGTDDGLNPSCAVLDEVHAHKKPDQYQVLKSAFGSRPQPLLFGITTSGVLTGGIGQNMHRYAIKVLEGVFSDSSEAFHDDSFFAFIAAIDEGDDYKDESNWIKANPNLGVSVKISNMREHLNTTVGMPMELNNFLCKRLNVWTNQSVRWIDPDTWKRNGGIVVEAALFGRDCYGGLDLATVSDMAALCWAFPGEDEQIDFVYRYWCPEARLHAKDNQHASQYQVWAREGWLTTTPGNAIDYQFIKAAVIADAAKFAVKGLNVDRLFQGYQIMMELADEGLEVIPFGMGYMSMGCPMKDFERRLLDGKLNHGNNPITEWMAGNVSVRMDPAGNLKPDKEESQGKIDGIVAMVMSIDRLGRAEQTGPSIYETRGLSFV